MSKRTVAPQEKILSFIETYHSDHMRPPTVREIQREMGYKSPRAVSYFLEKMERDNLIIRKARSRGIFLRKSLFLRKTFQIPFYDRIREELVKSPEGNESKVAEKNLAVDIEALGLDPNGTYFAVNVAGQDMVCAGIFEGDTAILEVKEPQYGDIVAIREENGSKLYRYAQVENRDILKLENFHDPCSKSFESHDAQGVLVSLIRRVKTKNCV